MKIQVCVRVEATVRATRSHFVEIEIDNPDNRQELEQKALLAATQHLYIKPWIVETPNREQIRLHSATVYD